MAPLPPVLPMPLVHLVASLALVSPAMPAWAQAPESLDPPPTVSLPAGEPACSAGSSIERLGPPSPSSPFPAALPPLQASLDDYRHKLRPTPYGWPRRDHWCVWVEPVDSNGASARWAQAWQVAVDAALERWGDLVAISRVEEPERAQVLVRRRRPPLRDGRASHGRAELELVLRSHKGITTPEPRVVVSISPGQRQAAMQATALHELGHAFGLWGHSDHPADAMAAVPGPVPVLELTPRDRATFRWLQQQPGLQVPQAPPN